jgi:hypothetical protein
VSKLQPHKWQRHEWHAVADSRGRIQGKYQSPSELLRDDLEIVRNFLITINRRKEDMAQQQKEEQTNMVFLAGKLKFDPKVFDNNTTALIDVGLKSSIQVSIFTGENAPDGNAALSAKLKRFKEGDFIKLVAMLRPYGVKNGEKWKNSISIDVTTIKNDPPPRGSSRQQQADDDAVPF